MCIFMPRMVFYFLTFFLFIWEKKKRFLRLTDFMVLFPGIPMEIYIISDGKVVPYLQHPEFDKSIPVIPPKVDTVNLTWEAGHETVCISSLHVCTSPNFFAYYGLIYYLIFKRYLRPSATTSVSRRFYI